MTPIIKRVSLRYYKSISKCDVACSNVTILVGPNGSGKSNFLDSLCFISDALSSTLDYAIRQRSGVGAVRKRSGGHPTHFAISIQLHLPSGRNAAYSFEIGAKQGQAFVVQRERATIEQSALNLLYFEYEAGKIKGESSDLRAPTRVAPDRLALQLMSSYEDFQELYFILAGMKFYSIYPEDFRLPQPHDNGNYLTRTGKNISAVLNNIRQNYPDRMRRVEDYIRRIVRDIDGLEYQSLGPVETIEFKQKVTGQKYPWKFSASQMSDGTLRSVGILISLFQPISDKLDGNVIGIEEPESTIHPAACAVIMDAIKEVSTEKQIFITTHSPNLLDHEKVEIGDIRVVKSIDGNTTIAPADAASISLVKDKLATPGELLGMNQLEQDRKNIKSQQFTFNWN